MRRGGGRERRHTDRGQAETIGVVLVMSLTLVGATIALALGAAAIGEIQVGSQEEGIQNAMTQLDSRAAMVGLGDSSAQHVPMARGSYRVDPDAGRINVTHHNYSGLGDTEVLFNDSLGAVIYEQDGRSVAYQGGGVWKSDGDGSTMVSPPEFHYRAATLTLPLIRVLGSDSVSGAVTAEISAESSVRRVFPNDTTYGDGTPYANPVGAGNVTVTIQSTYYQAWADFFETRTDGDITVDATNQTVHVLLITPSTVGPFDMPNEGNGVLIQDLGDDHPIEEFTITLQGDPHFQEMHWAFYAEEDDQELEIHFFSPGKCNGGTYNDELDISIYYYNGTGGYYEGWQNSSIDPATNPDVDVDCSTKEMTIDLMGSTAIEYKEIDITGSDNKWHFGNQINDNDVAPTTVLDQHDVDGNTSYDADTGDKAEMGFLVDHYIQRLGPTLELKVTDGPGGSSRINEEESSGTLDYEGGTGNKFITFLHITENRVQVELR